MHDGGVDNRNHLDLRGFCVRYAPAHMDSKPQVELFTDGACSGNPGPGGWGYILRSADGTEREGSGGERETTNNRMELLGAIEGLRQLKKPCRVRLVSDSQYLVKGLSEWIDGWKRRGWRRKEGPVMNVEL
ncbi:MAG: Ribonuclease, partial [Planctomycetota bacterium]